MLLIMPLSTLFRFSMSYLRLNGVTVKDAYDVSSFVSSEATFLKDLIICCLLKAKSLIMVIVQ